MTLIKIFVGADIAILEEQINQFLQSHILVSSSITYANAQFIITVYYSQPILLTS